MVYLLKVGTARQYYCVNIPRPTTRDFSKIMVFNLHGWDNLVYEITQSMAAKEIERLSRLSERLRKHNWINIRSADRTIGIKRWSESIFC